MTSQSQSFAKDFPFDNSQAILSTLRRLMVSLDGRFKPLEDTQVDYQTAIVEMKEVALGQINSILIPLYDQLHAATQLGSLFQSTSTTAQAVRTGIVQFVINPAQWESFTPSAFMAAVCKDNTNVFMSGVIDAYDPDAGVVSIHVTTTNGSGTYANWYIMPAVPVAIPSTIDPGYYDEVNGGGSLIGPVVETDGIGQF